MIKWYRHTFFLVILCISISAAAQDWRQHFEQGNKAFQLGEYSTALKHYRDAQDLAPENVNIHDLINQSAYRSQNFSDAATGYQEAAKRAQNLQEKSQAHYNLGNAHFKNNNVDKAIEAYKEALRNDPKNDKARYNLAYAMKKKQDQEKNEENQNNNQDNNQDDKEDQNDGQNERQNDDQNDNEGQENNKNEGNNPEENDPKEGQSSPQQLSQDQTEQLLDALMRAEEGAKDKLDKEKDKGVPVSERKKKDW